MSFGAYFPTASHPDTPPRSKKTIQQALDVPIPIYAIGGINEHSIQRCHLDLKVYVPYHILTMLH